MKAPAVIAVEGVHKSFRIGNGNRAAGLRSRFRPPERHRGGRELQVLRDVSFEVGAGEFFGIVGRNGSGKSTLLKLLASIYRADRGRIRIAGRLAPFLELGVGFNPELAARDNIVLNGVMMGLSADQARNRFEEIIEFAGLEDYTDLKLKNYSSGMKVRLGFAVMTHVEADVLLIDEVLAVGDHEFQEKCGETFRSMHEEGRTIVLVTHSMEAIGTYCERAMLIDDGVIAALGDPQEVANRYYEVNVRAAMGRRGSTSPLAERIVSVLTDPLARIERLWLQDAAGRRTETVDPGQPIEAHAVIAAHAELSRPGIFVRLNDQRGQTVFERFNLPLEGEAEGSLGPGERVRVRATVGNRLEPGRYTLYCAVNETAEGGSPQPAAPPQSVRFDVTGEPSGGLVSLDVDVASERIGTASVVSR